MDAGRFGQMARHLSRRGVAALLWIGMLVGRVPDVGANGVGRCGGTPTQLTRLCGGAGVREIDADCAAGCACVLRREGCCFRVKKRTKRGGSAKRKWGDGAPAMRAANVAEIRHLSVQALALQGIDVPADRIAVTLL